MGASAPLLPFSIYFWASRRREHLLHSRFSRPPLPVGGPAEIGARGPGRGRARAGLQGGCLSLRDPSAVPGVVAALGPGELPAGRILGGGGKKERGRGGAKEGGKSINQRE